MSDKIPTKIVSKETVSTLHDASWECQRDGYLSQRLWELMRLVEAELGMTVSDPWDE